MPRFDGFVDMHCHIGFWSPDAEQSAEELLEGAAEKQLAGAALADHYDIDSATENGEVWVFDTKRHIDENAKYRKRPSKKRPGDAPGLLTGIEIGYLPHCAQLVRNLIAENAYDCVILSMHEIDGKNPVCSARDIFTEDTHAVYARVISLIAESAESVPEANIIGHFDFFSRYAPDKTPKMLYRHAPEAFDRLFCAIIRNNQALEINTKTIEALHRERGYSLWDAMPDTEILARYRALGGTLVTLGSDAHRKEDVARYFPQAAEWLKSQGVQSLCWMEERRWYTAPL